MKRFKVCLVGRIGHANSVRLSRVKLLHLVGPKLDTQNSFNFGGAEKPFQKSGPPLSPSYTKLDRPLLKHSIVNFNQCVAYRFNMHKQQILQYLNCKSFSHPREATSYANSVRQETGRTPEKKKKKKVCVGGGEGELGLCVPAYMHACVYTCICACVYTCVCACVHTCVCACVHACMCEGSKRVREGRAKLINIFFSIMK